MTKRSFHFKFLNDSKLNFDYSDLELTLEVTPVNALCCSFSLHTLVPFFLPGKLGWFCFSFLSQFPAALLP